MNMHLRSLLKIIGVAFALGVILLVYFLITFEIDLTHCRETNATHQLEQGYIEYEIGELYINMYVKEFDLNYSEVETYTQLASTTNDFTVGHVYLKSPNGIIYACGWHK